MKHLNTDNNNNNNNNNTYDDTYDSKLRDKISDIRMINIVTNKDKKKIKKEFYEIKKKAKPFRYGKRKDL